jgi:photosystem II stability/assembly factor-like uncharacterized protein
MLTKEQNDPTGIILIAAFLVLLAWFFLASYRGHQLAVNVQEKMLTVHDDLLAIDGRHNGNKIVVGKFGVILLTQDGGKTWQTNPSGTTVTLSGVSFADHQHGFVVGSGGTLLASSDGGATWRPQDSGTKDQLLNVHAVSPVQAFAVGAFGTLISTSDGGQKWNKHELPWETLIERIVQEGGLVEPNLNAIYFSSAELGWAVGEFGLVLHTQDGGRTWAAQRYGIDLPQLYAVKFVDQRRGWAMGQAGSLIYTQDGGQRWSAVESDNKRDLYDATFQDERGVLVGDGVILLSGDGGSSWRSSGANSEDGWLSGAALKSSEAIVVGGAGTIRLLSLDK